MCSPAICGVALAVCASGCGQARRDAKEPRGAFTAEVVARFPRRQTIAHDTTLQLTVRNRGRHTMPDVAVTLDSFYYRGAHPHLASDRRPVWIVNTGPGAVAAGPPVQTEEVNPPGGGETVFVDTWALGALGPGASRSFAWHVTPVKAGIHTVHYTVAAGLDGKARAQLADGQPVTGSLVARIAPAPAPTHVNPLTGRVVAGANPVSATPVGAVP